MFIPRHEAPQSARDEHGNSVFRSEAMKTSVVIVDDHVSVRQMLAVVLSREGVYDVVAEAGTGVEALKICRHVKPRMVILDLLLPELSGIEVLRALRAESRETRVLIYTASHHDELILRVLQERPHGFVHKEDTLATLREALRVVANGCSYLTPFATDLLDCNIGHEKHGIETLTARERAVLQMVAEGLSSKEVAARLALSTKTVEYHRGQLMQKLRVHEVAGLTRCAVRHGLVAID